MLNVPGLAAASEASPMFGGLRVLISEQELAFVNRLRLSLECIPQIEIVGAASSPIEFKRILHLKRPNIVISNVNVGEVSCFDVLAEAAAAGIECEVIFLAPSAEHALRAFDISAVDYIVKPASFERIQSAITKAAARLWTRLATSRFNDLQQRIDELEMDDVGVRSDYIQTLWFKNGEELCQVAVDDVEWFQAAGDYVVAHTADHSHLVSESISGLEAKLSPSDVLRVHRSSIVNVNRVRSLRKRRPRGLALVLNSGKQVVIGPKFEASVLALMNAPRWR